MIRSGRADVVVAGGTEAAIHPLPIAGFAAMQALSTRNDDPAHASRPYDPGRDGFVLGEGAGIVVLESEEHARARGARVYAELAGAVEGIFTILALHHRLAPPTINVGRLDPDVALDVVLDKPRQLPDGDLLALNNSFGFGGHNVALAIRTAS